MLIPYVFARLKIFFFWIDKVALLAFLRVFELMDYFLLNDNVQINEIMI